MSEEWRVRWMMFGVGLMLGSWIGVLAAALRLPH